MLVDTIRHEMSEKGLRQVDMVRLLGENQSVVAKYLSLNDSIRLDIPNTILAKIANILDVDIEYLLGMQDEKRSTRCSSEIQSYDDLMSIPIAYTGAGAEAIMDIETIEKIHIEKKLLSKDILLKVDNHTMAFKIIGDSMTPKYNEDDILFVDMINGRSVKLGDGVWLIRIGDTVQIKQIQFLGNNEANIISINSTYPTINTKDSNTDWDIIGKPFMRWGVEYFSGLVLG